MDLKNHGYHTLDSVCIKLVQSPLTTIASIFLLWNSGFWEWCESPYWGGSAAVASDAII